MKHEQNIIFKAKLPIYCSKKGRIEHKEVTLTLDQLKIHFGPTLNLSSITSINHPKDGEIYIVSVSTSETTVTFSFTESVDQSILFAILTVATNPKFKSFFSLGIPIACIASFGDIICGGTSCLEYLISIFPDDTGVALSGSGSVHSTKSVKSPKHLSPQQSPRANGDSHSIFLDPAPKCYTTLFNCLSDQGVYGMASIHIVCSFDRVDMLKLLFTAGMNISMQSSQERGKQTPLHYCLHDEKGSVQCFTYLVKELNASTHIENAYGLTVLAIVDAQWPGTYYHSLLDRRNDILSNKTSARGSICSGDD